MEFIISPGQLYPRHFLLKCPYLAKQVDFASFYDFFYWILRQNGILFHIILYRVFCLPWLTVIDSHEVQFVFMLPWITNIGYDSSFYIQVVTFHNNWFSCSSIRYKNLKIPKGLSESVNRRRTDNTMAKRKRTKAQTTIYKPYIQN